MNVIHEVIIIGAGQAGIAMSQKLKKQGISHLMIDSHSYIGEQWDSRYDSLILFTPRNYSSLPGLLMEGDPNGYPTKGEMASYLKKYVQYFDLPVALNVKVEKLKKEENIFIMQTSKGELAAKKVVVATGAFQSAFIPPIIHKDSEGIEHIHSSKYTNPKAISSDSVLIVGGGNSGAQIAVELANSKNVYLATSHKMNFLPLRVLGESIFKWLDKCNLLYAGLDTKRGELFKKRNDPIFGYELKRMIRKNKITIKPRVEKVIGKQVFFADGSKIDTQIIIWSTGFKASYKWINIEGALSEVGKPNHNRGISPIENLYFIGLPWQYHRGSALVCGVGRDAEYLLNSIIS
ncbi:flavin-containing monooxygenase [Amphibacillus marinus]|uniref:flavin-containing monooxygenase n=1 Tax=Amphibacillus marinus TaxID=872970 RepID=UPI000B86E7CB|nr:NAD(P)/FAD-dependent oxidoreductase [Amphibacillus marinus]